MLLKSLYWVTYQVVATAFLLIRAYFSGRDWILIVPDKDGKGFESSGYFRDRRELQKALSCYLRLNEKVMKVQEENDVVEVANRISNRG